MSVATNDKIHRIKKLKLNNFRGFKDPRELNTDADIVLLTGPNGFGKTSVVDALRILLTGYDYKSDNELIFRNGKKRESLARIEADVMTEISQSARIAVDIKYNKTFQFKVTGHDWKEDKSAREMSARASFFYQDMVSYLFDEEGATTTLGNFFQEIPEEVTQIKTKLSNSLKEIETREKEIDEKMKVQSEINLKEERIEVIKSFALHWELLIQEYVKWGINLPVLPRIFTNERGFVPDWQRVLGDWVEGLCSELSVAKPFPLENDMETIINLINKILQDINNKIVKEMNTKHQCVLLYNRLSDKKLLFNGGIDTLKQKLDEINKNIKKYNQRLSILNELAKHFQIESTSDPDLFEIISTIQEHGKYWLQIPEQVPSELKPPERVMNWLQATYDSIFFDDISIKEVFEEWLNMVEREIKPLYENITEQQNLKKSIEEDLNIIEQIYKIEPDQKKLKEYVSQTAYQVIKEVPDNDPINDSLKNWLAIELKIKDNLKKLKMEKHYQDAKEHIKKVKDILNDEIKGSKSVIDAAVAVPEEIRDRLKELVNDIFQRFRIVEGLHPITFKESGIKAKKWQIITASGKELSTLSTGQKSQLGLALLLGLNIILEDNIGHNIIALDDTTATFDMSQLSREASLLRQLAYGEGGTEVKEGPRRQMFIVSHHEELTLSLKKFLLPPKGRKMHIINFINWSPEKGSEIEQFEVIPPRSITENREDFGRFISEQIKSR